ncbi:hypothetical protein [Legionella gresilensis]|uniref:hypothetical protein n=1 Tax=Legionella gresilensis TaxID=91823 RepID=UPI001040E0FB|nr:hypothetical protein [Legionella gresilensis]
MALFKFKAPEINFRNFLKNNWKSAAAIGGAVVGAVGVGALCLFFPPAIPFIAGITIFGAAPFAGLASMSVVAASFAAAGIAAAAAVGFSAVVNAVTKVSNLMDNLFRTKKTHITDFPNERIVSEKGYNPFTNSPYHTPELAKKVTDHNASAANASNLDPEVRLNDKRAPKVELKDLPHTKVFHEDKPIPAVEHIDTTVTQEKKVTLG